MTRASVSAANPVSENGNTEFGLHVFKRRASGQKGDRYTIGAWDGTQQRAICHDASIDDVTTSISWPERPRYACNRQRPVYGCKSQCGAI
jgi:hypothetical protein